jgi:hypothetical protein
MRTATPTLPNTPSWYGAQFKRNVRTTLPVGLIKCRTGNFGNVIVIFHAKLSFYFNIAPTQPEISPETYKSQSFIGSP